MGGPPLTAKLAQSALCGLFAAAIALAEIDAPFEAKPARKARTLPPLVRISSFSIGHPSG